MSCTLCSKPGPQLRQLANEAVQPLAGRSWLSDARTEDNAAHPERGLTPRLGAIVNYEPELVLSVSQPFDDSIQAIDLGVGGPPGNEVFASAQSSPSVECERVGSPSATRD